MKSAVIYYSFSGNTSKVAQVLAGYLRDQGEVSIIELKTLDESNKFFMQALRAFRHKKAEIEPADFNLLEYNLVCFGTPVWAFGPAPAMNAYLDKCRGLQGQEVILFTTYGSGTGNGRCLNHMQNILARKGITGFKRFSIQQGKVHDREAVWKAIEKAMPPSGVNF
jgi:flavodoxin